MNNSILLQSIDIKELEELIKKGLEAPIEALKKDLLHQKTIDELLTRKEACEFLKIDSSTLWSWTNKGKVKAYGVANRRYYKRHELIEALKPVLK